MRERAPRARLSREEKTVNMFMNMNTCLTRRVPSWLEIFTYTQRKTRLHTATKIAPRFQ